MLPPSLSFGFLAAIGGNSRGRHRMTVDVEAPLPRTTGPRIARIAVSVARPLLGQCC